MVRPPHWPTYKIIQVYKNIPCTYLVGGWTNPFEKICETRKTIWKVSDKKDLICFDFRANLHFQSKITVSPFNHLTKIPFNHSIKTSSAPSKGRNTSKHLWELIFYLPTSLGVASKLFKIQHLDIIFNWCCTIITIQHDFRHLQKNPAVLQGRTPMLVVNGVLGYN